MPRTSNRNTPERDEEGRFTSGNRGSQASSRRDDDDNDERQTSGRSSQGRGWFGDPEGHAEAGRHSHENDRGTARSSSRYEDDDDRDYRSSDRNSGGRGRPMSEDEDYADWHAYGHDRGWHAHQQLDGFTNRGHRRDDDRQSSGRGGGQGRGWFGDPEGHAEAGRHSHDNDRDRMRAGGRDDDDDRRGSRNRDDEGRFTSNGRH